MVQVAKLEEFKSFVGSVVVREVHPLSLVDIHDLTCPVMLHILENVALFLKRCESPKG